MLKPATVGKRGHRKSPWRWVRRLFWLVIILIVTDCPLVHYWLAPSALRWGLSAWLKTYWPGQINVEKVEISLGGEIVARDIALLGPNNRPWLRAKTVTLQLRNWPSLQPVLDTIDIERPVITGYLDNGRLNLPLQWPEAPETPADTDESPSSLSHYFDIRKISIRDIILRMGEAPRHPPVVSTHRPQLQLFQDIEMFGSARGGGDVDILLGRDMRIEADVSVQLDLKDIVITDLRRLLHQDPLAKGQTLSPLKIGKLQTQKITFRNGILRVPLITADSCGGDVWGMMRVRLSPGKPLAYDVKLRLHDINMRTFFRAYDPSQHIEFGRASALFDIDGETLDWGMMTLDGMVSFNNSDLNDTWLVRDVLDTMDVDEERIKNGSDLRAIFRVRDKILTFAEGQYGNNLLALIVEPGGTVDLDAQRVDIHVVTALLNDLRKVPFLRVISGLAGNLTRLRLEGNWNEPAEKLVRKEPLHDVARGTKMFFADVVESGGNILGAFD